MEGEGIVEITSILLRIQFLLTQSDPDPVRTLVKYLENIADGKEGIVEITSTAILRIQFLLTRSDPDPVKILGN